MSLKTLENNWDAPETSWNALEQPETPETPFGRLSNSLKLHGTLWAFHGVSGGFGTCMKILGTPLKPLEELMKQPLESSWNNPGILLERCWVSIFTFEHLWTSLKPHGTLIKPPKPSRGSFERPWNFLSISYAPLHDCNKKQCWQLF